MTLLHLIVSQGADSASESPRLSKDGRIYLEQAWLALPSVMSQPYRTSLQVLLLLCHALRTVSLHRFPRDSTDSSKHSINTKERRGWWQASPREWPTAWAYIISGMATRRVWMRVCVSNAHFWLCR